ncbi:MAG: tRNA (adenosine(37)-N6)-threonylcarbamoyltransferase complex ATPase subunit type 1 TsaE [Clostridiales bacterium]|nr:tRNA (adenosine(37)-N6)-threonylcarbamoyltransferase complex ATPase subunit type 1 TsaE [Clostridiales bacterium]
MIEIKAFSADDTIACGYKLAKLMESGGIILLDGDLGAGKTVFTTGIARALNISDYITSPTFTIVNMYVGDKQLNHFDVYRIEKEDLDDIGFWDYILPDTFVVIEWSQKIAGLLPRDTVEVNISKDLDKGLDYRSITIKCNGKYEELESKMI